MTDDWPVEDIPDEDRLFIALHRTHFEPDGTLMLVAFRDRGGGLSTNWAKYSTPEATRDRRVSPANNAVGALNVGNVRTSAGQRVRHDPDRRGNPERTPPLPPNRAHALIIGDRLTGIEARVALRRLCTIVLPLRPA